MPDFREPDLGKNVNTIVLLLQSIIIQSILITMLSFLIESCNVGLKIELRQATSQSLQIKPKNHAYEKWNHFQTVHFIARTDVIK